MGEGRAEAHEGCHIWQVGYDEDIATDPFYFLWAPDPENDSPQRKFQHYTWPFWFTLLFHSWRIDSLRHAFNRRWETRSPPPPPLCSHA